MTGATIDVGIDLGTTNSAIARMQRGMPFVIPNNLTQPITPSAVRINSAGTTFVGKAAYDYLVADPGNTAGEFKRWIGTPQIKTFESSRRQMNATELSGLVLQSLRGDLEVQGERTTAAVITVPAAFDLTQCAATQDAARLAGLEHAPLLQEPVAASLAYGYRLDLEGRCWLVYDLGGGTFDLALVGVRDGRVQVLDHEGDNYLGGKDFDWLLAENVLVPRLSERYSVDSFRRNNAAATHPMAILKARAEPAKIALSRDTSAIVTIDRAVDKILDDNGEAIEVDISVTQGEYENLITASVAQTIRLAQELLERNKTVPVDAVLMVGGSTLTPLVRRMVTEGLGIRVDTSANPLTVVAEGAALYAANQPLPSGLRSVSVPGNTTLDLIYRSVTDGDSELLGCVLPPDVATLELAAIDKSWSSGRLIASEGQVSVRVPLPANGPHEFSIIARTGEGTALAVEPRQITITRGLTAVAAPLSRAIGVVVEDIGGEQEVEWIIRKGASLPAKGGEEFRTLTALDPNGREELIRIHVAEGDENSNRPKRQRQVAVITITNRQVPRMVPAGNPISVIISVDESRLLKVEAYLPFIDQSFAAEIALGPDAVSAAELSRQIGEERERISALAQYVPAVATREMHDALHEAEKEADAAAGGGEDPTRALRALQVVQRRVDGIEDAQRLPMTVAEARAEAEIVSGVVGEFGDDGHKSRARALIVDLDEAIVTGSISEIRRAQVRLNRLKWELLLAQSDWWRDYFSYMNQNITRWTDSAQAEALLREGRLQIIREDWGALRKTTWDLRQLVPQEDQGRMGKFQDVGIRR